MEFVNYVMYNVQNAWWLKTIAQVVHKPFYSLTQIILDLAFNNAMHLMHKHIIMVQHLLAIIVPIIA